MDTTDALLDAAWRRQRFTLQATPTGIRQPVLAEDGDLCVPKHVDFDPKAVAAIGPSRVRYNSATWTATITPSVPIIDWMLREWCVFDPWELLARIHAEQMAARTPTLFPVPPPVDPADPADEDDFPVPPLATWHR